MINLPNEILFILLILYATVPPITLFYCLKWIYKDKWNYGWHFNWFFRYLFTLSFIPLLFFSNLDLGIIPKSLLSGLLLLSTVALALLGIKPGKLHQNLPELFDDDQVPAQPLEKIDKQLDKKK